MKPFNVQPAAANSRRAQLHWAWARSTLAECPRDSDRYGRIPLRPLLPTPRPTIAYSYRPPLYFSRGAFDADLRRNPPPIPYLLTETLEFAHARPVPNHPLLLRSLCKGKGTLRATDQGMIYLDIDNRFISAMLPYLKAYGLIRPPYFNLFSAPTGAHVPVISKREASFHYLDGLEEVGQEFSFEIEGLYSVEPTLWPEVEQVWFFKLRSPELEKLRRRHFLTERPGGNPFHIAVAIKSHPAKAPLPKPLPVMRVNVACLVA